MFHACDKIFDVTGNLENFCELNKALLHSWEHSAAAAVCTVTCERQPQPQLQQQLDKKAAEEAYVFMLAW